MRAELSTFERRMEMLSILMNHKLISRLELARRFSVSDVTIGEDIIALSRFAPIASKMGRYGGVYIMTRRLDPQERVDELGDASVPFNFDVHALIFTDDAPGLETALHNAFESKKLNKINARREFFAVSLDEIKAEVRKNFDKTVEWIDVPEAEQYRQSLLIK